MVLWKKLHDVRHHKVLVLKIGLPHGKSWKWSYYKASIGSVTIALNKLNYLQLTIFSALKIISHK